MKKTSETPMPTPGSAKHRVKLLTAREESLRRDCARLDWLTANLETFFTSKFHILAKFDGVRAGIDAAMKATK